MREQPSIDNKVLEMAAAIQPATDDSKGQHIKYLYKSFIELSDMIAQGIPIVEGIATGQLRDMVSHTMFARYSELKALVNEWEGGEISRYQQRLNPGPNQADLPAGPQSLMSD